MDIYKLGMCIDIVVIWIWIANGEISSVLTELSDHHRIVAGYYLVISRFYLETAYIYSIALL